jgi:hypothetical protein
MNHYQTPSDKDPHLWDIARKRASFKSHLFTYIIVNLFLWAIWFFTGSRVYNDSIPWPAWPTLGWGVGLAFHYIGAYMTHRDTFVDREYEKLIREKKQQ